MATEAALDVGPDLVVGGLSEIERGVQFMAKLREQHRQTPEEALRTFALLALNLNEFMYLD